MANVLTSTQPTGTKMQLLTQNQQAIEVEVIPEAGLGPTGPTGPTGPSGGAVDQPLSNTFFVDGGATGPSGPGGGSAINPYNSVTQALAERGALSPLVLLLTPGNYSEAPTYTGGGDFTLETLGDPLNPAIIIGTLTAAGANLTLNNVLANDVSCVGGQTCVKGVGVGTVDTGAFIFQGAGARQCTISGDVTCSAFQVSSAIIAGDLTASAAAGLDNTIEQSTFSGTQTVTVPAADQLQIDLYSLAQADLAGATITAPALEVLDGPTLTVTVTPTGISPVIEMLDAAVPDAVPGDTFAASIVDNGGTIALIGIPVCEVAGTVTLPVLTDGTDPQEVRLTRFAVSVAP